MIDFSKFKFGVVGAGLIGGSICKSLADNHPDATILVCDQNKDHSRELTEAVPGAKAVELVELKSCDIIFLCMPVSIILEHLSKLNEFSDLENSTIIDTGSSKLDIVKVVETLGVANFVPGHPLAGGNSSGPALSSAKIVASKPFVLCTTSCLDDNHYKRACELLESLKLSIVHIDAATHDKLLAITSHLPHLLAYSLVSTLSSIEKDDAVSSEGFRVNSFDSLTLFAQGAPEMWADVLMSNQRAVELGVQKFENSMKVILDLAAKGDRERLVAELSRLQLVRTKTWGNGNE